MKNIFILISLFTIIACFMKAKKEERESISLERAIRISMKEVEDQDGWDSAAMESEGEATDEGFKVVVWRIPKTPGGFRMVVVSPEGEIISYYKGK